MKRLMFAAALMIGTAAIAQTTPPADPAAPPPPGEPMAEPMEDSTTTPAPMEEPMPDGAAEPMQGQPMQQQMPMSPPSGNVRFQQPPSVAQAFPPPAPRADYPVCSRGVTDGCVQRRGSPRPPGSPRG